MRNHDEQSKRLATLSRRAFQAGATSWVLGCTSALGGGQQGTSGQPSQTDAKQTREPASGGKAWRMGLIADLHYGLAPDALQRLDRFMESVAENEPDCMLQLGDFNYGVDSQECMHSWNQFAGPKYHVLGNHDMDKVTKDEIVDAWHMPGHYYSFDRRGWHFVVLDRNHIRGDDQRYVDYAKANFYIDGALRGFADPEQLEWLEEDLDRTQLPTVVFSHQGLGMDSVSVEDSANGQIESVLAGANRGLPQPKVRACFCGHHHLDRYNHRDGIHFVWINSASYYWVGAAYGRMAPYTDPLFSFLTFHPDQSIEIAPCQTEWRKPTPRERQYPEWESLTPEIVGRRLG